MLSSDLHQTLDTHSVHSNGQMNKLKNKTITITLKIFFKKLHLHLVSCKIIVFRDRTLKLCNWFYITTVSWGSSFVICRIIFFNYLAMSLSKLWSLHIRNKYGKLYHNSSRASWWGMILWKKPPTEAYQNVPFSC